MKVIIIETQEVKFLVMRKDGVEWTEDFCQTGSIWSDFTPNGDDGYLCSEFAYEFWSHAIKAREGFEEAQTHTKF